MKIEFWELEHGDAESRHLMTVHVLEDAIVIKDESGQIIETEESGQIPTSQGIDAAYRLAGVEAFARREFVAAMMDDANAHLMWTWEEGAGISPTAGKWVR